MTAFHPYHRSTMHRTTRPRWKAGDWAALFIIVASVAFLCTIAVLVMAGPVR